MPADHSATSPPSKGRVFLRRLFSTVILWTIILAALFSGNPTLSNYVFLLIICGLALVGLVEFYGLVHKRGLPAFRGWGIAGGLMLLVSTFFYLTESPAAVAPARVNDFEVGFLILFVLGICLLQIRQKEMGNGMVALGTTLFGLMYVPWLLNFIQKINFFPGVDGRYFLLYFILVTKFSDVGAYVTGSLIGRHKMIPRISPGKTWEGFAGALCFSVASSLAFAHWAGGKLPGLTLPHAAILGAVLGLSAVVGDLIESLLKREAGVKDSGGFFPGIGGILDLLDSLLFNAPLMYLYLRHVLQ